MPVVCLHGVHKAHGNKVVLRSVDFTLRSGERVGVVGKNGAGKSTLAKIIAGLEVADQGELIRRRGARIAMLEQVPRFDGDPTAAEAVMSGLSAWSEASARHAKACQALADGQGDVSQWLTEQTSAGEEVERLGGWDQDHRVAAMMEALAVRRPDAHISELSGGEQRRVALARLLISRPDLAIFDEPTNHLDAETTEWLERTLIEDFPSAVLLITHDRYLLDRVAMRTLEVADGEAFSYDGGYELYLQQKAERQMHAARVESNRQNFLRRELEWLQRQPKARTTKQAARIDRAEAALSVDRPRTEKAFELNLELVRSGKTILELKDISGGIGGKTLFSNVTFYLTQGERVGIIGPNGSGKTTLLRTLLGQLPPSSGTLVVGQNTRFAYFDQQRSGLEDDKTVFENVCEDSSRIEFAGEQIEPRTYLERFGFDNMRQRQPVGSLSGGERARVALARLLRQGANVVVLDEPTNDLDVSTLGALESMLVDSGVTALVVTHDRWFLDRVATSLLVFESDGTVTHSPGNYETLRRLRAERAQSQRPAPSRSTAPVAKGERSQRGAGKKSLSFAEERELAGLPDAIEQAELGVSGLLASLAEPSTYAGGGAEAARLNTALEQAKAGVERLTARWEALETKKSLAAS